MSLLNLTVYSYSKKLSIILIRFNNMLVRNLTGKDIKFFGHWSWQTIVAIFIHK